MTDRAPLLLLPGLLCDAELWRHQLDHMGDVADMTVADFTEGRSMADFAQRALDAAPAERFALAGLSMGGYVAFEIMRRAPERVSRLALLDTWARPDTEELLSRRRGLIELAEMGEFKGVTPRLLPLLVHEERLEDEALTKEVIDMAGRIGKAAFLDQQRAIMARPDSRPVLDEIDCPTLTLCGRQDALTSPEMHAEMADGIAGAALVVIEDCGHLSPMEKPEAVTAVLRYWLQKG